MVAGQVAVLRPQTLHLERQVAPGVVTVHEVVALRSAA